MAATVFATPQNNCSTTVGAAGYTAGSGFLALAAGGGTLLPPLSGGNYCRATVIRSATAYVPNAPASTYTIFRVTAIGGDTLTLGGTLEGTTDRNYAAGDVVELRVTAGTLTDLQGVVNTLQTTSVPLTQPIVTITGATLLTAANFGCMHLCSGTSANYAITLPPPAGPPSNAGKSLTLAMAPGLTKPVTITPNAGELIDGASSRVMWANEVATLFCDGTNWTKVAGKSIPMLAQVYCSTNQSIANNVFVKILLNTVSQDNTGLMADTTNNQIKIVRPGTYMASGLLTLNPVPTASPNTQARIYRNGTAETAFSLPSIAVNDTPCLAPSYVKSAAVGDFYDLRMYQTSASSGVMAILGGSTYTYLLISEQPSW